MIITIIIVIIIVIIVIISIIIMADLKQDIDDEDVEDILQRVYNTVKHSLQFWNTLDRLQRPECQLLENQQKNVKGQVLENQKTPLRSSLRLKPEDSEDSE